ALPRFQRSPSCGERFPRLAAEAKIPAPLRAGIPESFPIAPLPSHQSPFGVVGALLLPILPDQHDLAAWRPGSAGRFDAYREFWSPADGLSRPKNDAALLICALRYQSSTPRLRLLRINHPHLVILISRQRR